MPNKPTIDTGTNGFDVDGKTYTYDTGLSEDAGGAQGNTDHGNVNVDGSTKDLTKKTKTTLAQFMSDTTKGLKGPSKATPNRYPVDPGSNDFNTSGDKGNPTPTPGAPDNSVSFAPVPPDVYTPQYTTLRPSIKKGKSSAPAFDGNDVLPGLVGDSTYVAPVGNPKGDAPLTKLPAAGHKDTSNVVKPYVSAILSNNRFTDTSRWVNVDPLTPPANYDPTLRHGLKLGTSTGGDTVSLDRLAQVGPILTMRAGLELNSGERGFNANSTAGDASALLPGAAQLALTRVEQKLLLAKDVLDSLTNEEVPGADIISPGGSSWGALNNTEDQFAGVGAVGMAALSTALVAGLLLVIDGFSTVLGMITSPPKHPTRDSQGRYALGSYYGGLKKKSDGGLLGSATALLNLDIGQLLGIQPTVYPFSVALKKGSSAFFGIDDSGGVLSQLGGAISNSLTPNAGFNAIVARTIVRSSQTILDQLKKVGGNPINAVKQVLDLVDVLRSSKIISACNVFAQLGDAILSVPTDWTDADAQGAGDKVSSMDASRVESAVARNRLPGSLKLAWASNRSPAQLLMSQQVGAVSRVAKSLGSYDTHAGLNDPETRIQLALIKQDAVPRISTEDAARFERILDAEYVPFYFHDIRTNEMVAFHAFLASLSDDFTAAYDSVDAYGRVEPVKIYKNTHRRINLSFYVAATSQSDLDDMWTKINKLVTLVYPQYTQGKELVSADTNFVFTQPFSQLIGAAPLIRLRLGDLIKSNYSRFNLARLFGLGNTNFTLDGKQFSNFDKFDQEAIQQQLPAAMENAKTTAGKTFNAAPGSYTLYTNKGASGFSPPDPFGSSGDKPKFAAQFVPTGNPDFFEVKIVKENPDDPRSVIGEIQVTTDAEARQSLADIINDIQADYGSGAPVVNRVIGGRYVFMKNTLVPSQATRDAAVDAIVVSAEDEVFAQPLQDFMSDTGKTANAVAKSFKETGGKGLAGFIETMGFDWFDKVTWETGLKDRIVPKMCKVTIAFSPIHDISPGLDHLGVNRAPVYPVGQLAPRPQVK